MSYTKCRRLIHKFPTFLISGSVRSSKARSAAPSLRTPLLQSFPGTHTLSVNTTKARSRGQLLFVTCSLQSCESDCQQTLLSDEH